MRVRLHDTELGLTPAAYDAVLKLRRHGHRVFCAKREDRRETHHELDGQIVPTSWVMDMARASLECRECGCTDQHACDDNGVGCHWVEPDLCSKCAARDEKQLQRSMEAHDGA
ncbi:hypothetical protein [Dongia deserti]|uniref:hypothetical protein n=1 Tax=Dongia deserti TaxID=2268030 RepID=UPI000E64940F|nr:hypothetical protein [Dongia deserti]